MSDETDKLQNVTNSYIDQSPRIESSTDVTVCMSQLPALEKQTISRRLYEYLQGEPYPVSPGLIALRTGLNRASIRVMCRRLLKEGLIRQPYSGHYCGIGCNSAIHGVGALRLGVYSDESQVYTVGPLLQNMVVVCDVGECEKFDDYCFTVVDAEIRLVFGSKRNQISLYVSCSNGVGIHAFSLIVTRVEDYLLSLGFTQPFNWLVVNYELLVDGVRYRLEGIEALTVQVFEGELHKLYNKSYGVRGEYRSSAPVDLRSFMSIVSGHGGDLRSAARLGAIEDEIRKLTEAVKYNNGEIARLNSAYSNSQKDG